MLRTEHRQKHAIYKLLKCFKLKLCIKRKLKFCMTCLGLIEREIINEMLCSAAANKNASFCLAAIISAAASCLLELVLVVVVVSEAGGGLCLQ